MNEKEIQVIQYILWKTATDVTSVTGRFNIHGNGSVEKWTSERLYKLWKKYITENNL